MPLIRQNSLSPILNLKQSFFIFWRNFLQRNVVKRFTNSKEINDVITKIKG